MAGWQSIELMSVESAILRAYALASQCRYIEAERELKSVPEALETPHGIDLYARILWAAGQRAVARSLWEELSRTCPDFEPAAKALSADANALNFECESSRSISKRNIYTIVALVAIAVGASFSVGKFCGSPTIQQQPTRPAVIAETMLPARFGGSELRALKDGILTNLTKETVLIIRGGSGKFITDRQRKLAVIADCIKEIAGVPVTRMYFQPSESSTNDVILQIVPAYSKEEASPR